MQFKSKMKVYKYPCCKCILWLAHSRDSNGGLAFRLPSKHDQSQQHDLVPLHIRAEVLYPSR